MNDFLLSLLLGVIEGVTEFLPVSSTGHLRIAEAIMHLPLQDSFWKMYTIVIQLGAILALPVYFGRRILAFLSTFPGGERGDRNLLNHPLSLVLIAFVVTAIPAFLLKKLIHANLENLSVIAWALLIGGVIMWVVDAVCTKPRVQRMEGMNVGQAVWIGALQVLSAVFPGTSRSMATIAAGQLAGLSRAAALEFSFFVSIPTMVVATGYEFYKTVLSKHSELGVVTMNAHLWLVLALGFVVSFIVALAVVAWFMNWVRSRGFVPFAVYRIVLGVVVLLLLARGLV